MIVRTPWEDFPPVIVHTNGSNLTSHPAYSDAKAGDTAAARRLVKDVFVPIRVRYVSYDFVVPVQHLDPEARWNPIPMEFAKRCALENKAKLCPLIVQDNIVQHPGNANSIHRLLSQPSFIGSVPRGKYLIVDDFVTNGSTLANLRGFINHSGSSTVLASSIAAGYNSTKLAPEPYILNSIRARFSNELSLFPERLGFTAECFTNKESYFVNGLQNLESIRNPLAPTHYSIRPG